MDIEKIFEDLTCDADEADAGEKRLSITVPASADGSRLDSFAAAAAAEAGETLSRSQAARLCEEGRVTVGGTAARKNRVLSAGETVEISFPAPVPDRVLPEDIPLDVIYEDGDIIVVNKPAGMVVHPSPGHASGTLCAALLFHCGGSLSGIGGVSRPGIVHRIDMDTSGLLVAAKNDAAHLSLAAQIKEHSCFREYAAVTVGCPPVGLVTPASGRERYRLTDYAVSGRENPLGGPGDVRGTVDLPVGRHPTDRKKMAAAVCAAPREAVTHWLRLKDLGRYSYIRCRLETGRTHQIRVHMSYVGHPVLGDPLYGGDRDPVLAAHPSLAGGQFLHAAGLELTHPSTGRRMSFSCPLPERFEKLLSILSEVTE
jgi:23S rRNA pseudouridine1911/1915/1917 synthase